MKNIFYIVSGYHNEEGHIYHVFNTLKDAQHYFKENKQCFAYGELKKARYKKGCYYAESVEIYNGK